MTHVSHVPLLVFTYSMPTRGLAKALQILSPAEKFVFENYDGVIVGSDFHVYGIQLKCEKIRTTLTSICERKINNQ